MKQNLLPFLLAIGGLVTAAGPDASAQSRDLHATYLQRTASVDARVADLLSRMTLEEKIAQLRCTTRKVEWGKNLTPDGIGGVGPIFRRFTATMAAESINQVQRMAIDRTRLGIPILFHDEALHGLIGTKVTSRNNTLRAVVGRWSSGFIWGVFRLQ